MSNKEVIFKIVSWNKEAITVKQVVLEAERVGISKPDTISLLTDLVHYDMTVILHGPSNTVYARQNT